jgi:hypothetical protein
MNSVSEFLVMYEWVYRAGVRNPAFTEQFINKDVLIENEAEQLAAEEDVTELPSADEENTEGSVAIGDEQDRLLNSLKDVITK